MEHESIPEQQSRVTAKNLQAQSLPKQNQSTEVPNYYNFLSNPFKSLIFALGIILMTLSPMSKSISDPSYLQRIYRFVPSWYTTYIVLTSVSNTAILLTAFMRKKRIAFYLYLLLYGIQSILEFAVFKPVQPQIYFGVRLIIMVLIFALMKRLWRVFS